MVARDRRLPDQTGTWSTGGPAGGLGCSQLRTADAVIAVRPSATKAGTVAIRMACLTIAGLCGLRFAGSALLA